MHGVSVLPVMARRVTVVAISAGRRQDSQSVGTQSLLSCLVVKRAKGVCVSVTPAGGGAVIEPVVVFLRHVSLRYVGDVVDRQAAADVARHVGPFAVGVQVDHAGDHVRGERHDESLQHRCQLVL